MLEVYNSSTQRKEPLHTQKPNELSLYVCGVTVYDYCHIGHARVSVCFDAMVRYLEYLGYQVRYIRNITDIDDKIIKRAEETQQSWQALTSHFIEAMQEDMSALGVRTATAEPRATDFIPQMILMIQKLIERGHAYQASDGDVYYSVASYSEYGKLGRQDLEKLRAGLRVAVSEVKRDPLDFVLWKLAKPGEPFWDSPWGQGRPGWHIECSAMSMHYLGEKFDWHGGGHDLIFPHHENECAQAWGVTGNDFVNTWLHVGFVQIDSQKMSKSLGNFFTIREVLQKYPGEVIRYFLLSSHYRKPIHYSDVALQEAKMALSRLYQAVHKFEHLSGTQKTASTETIAVEMARYEARFLEAMNDDFNTPEALGVLFELARMLNRLQEENATPGEDLQALANLLRKLAAPLGLLAEDSAALLGIASEEKMAPEVTALIEKRRESRAAKDWATADQVRKELLEKWGIEIKDQPDGSIVIHHRAS